MPFSSRTTNYDHKQPVAITLWPLILRHTLSRPQQSMPTATKV